MGKGRQFFVWIIAVISPLFMTDAVQPKQNFHFFNIKTVMTVEGVIADITFEECYGKTSKFLFLQRQTQN